MQLAVELAAIVASSGVMAGVLKQIHRVARLADPVVFVGETGTGKSLLARLLHHESGRPGTIAELSAGELDAALGHDQLFGHERGAFTGAVSRRLGLFAEAGGGTVLLDDFQHLGRREQLLLLRVLDSQEYRPLGADRRVGVQARVVVGTSRPLDELMAEGTLIPDLRYRLGYLEVHLPRLSERVEDIALLASKFLQGCVAPKGETGPTDFDPYALAALEIAPWPGNVRELKAVVRGAFAVALGDSLIRLEHLPEPLRITPRFDPAASVTARERIVAWALRVSKGKCGEAAELIGAHRNTVTAFRKTDEGGRGRTGTDRDRRSLSA